MKPKQPGALPEKAGYTKYFEHDGALRAYRHAATGPSETASCCPDWQRGDARRFKTGRLL